MAQTYSTPLCLADNSGNKLVTKYKYDHRGNVTAEVNSKGETTYYTYDSANRLKSKAYADSYGGQRKEKLTLTYGDQSCTDKAVSSLTITDDMGHKTAYWFDNMGYTVKEGANAKELENYSGWKVTQYEYDGYHNLTVVTDPRGNKTTFTRDRLSRLTKKETPDGAVTTYTYTTFDQPETIQEPDGKCTQYFYDGAGRLSQQWTGWGSEIAENYEYQSMEYDLSGNPISVSLGRSREEELDLKMTYGYDNHGRLVDRYEWIEAEEYRHTQLQYDAFGNQICSATYGDVPYDDYVTETADYDIFGRVLRQSKSAYLNGENVGTNLVEYDYDKAGNVVQNEPIRERIPTLPPIMNMMGAVV
ncbi:MAG: hypothetical protein HFI90_01130 [Clostridia bacterium]|nr:hypothetical protein [Clostridia bacterium]